MSRDEERHLQAEEHAEEMARIHAEIMAQHQKRSLEILLKHREELNNMKGEINYERK